MNIDVIIGALLLVVIIPAGIYLIYKVRKRQREIDRLQKDIKRSTDGIGALLKLKEPK